MASRRALGNAKRFKILQRDGFRCQYCGRTPPTVILHVDHIVAVANGGTNDDENLVAACSDCNHGKFDKPLEPSVVPRDFKALGADAKAKARQLAQYREHLEGLQREMDRAVDLVGGAFWGSNLTWSYEKSQYDRRKVARFIELLGLGEVVESARIAYSRLPGGHGADRFKYFCGVCWNRCTALGIRGDGRAE